MEFLEGWGVQCKKPFVGGVWIFSGTTHSLKDVRAHCYCAFFCTSCIADHGKWTNMASSQCLILPRAKKGRFTSAASVRQRQLSSTRFKRINASRANTSSTDVHEEKLSEHECGDAEITWEDGWRVVELGVLAKGLEACSICEEPLQLKNIVEEKRYRLGSLLYVQCECSTLANPIVRRVRITDYRFTTLIPNWPQVIHFCIMWFSSKVIFQSIIMLK